MAQPYFAASVRLEEMTEVAFIEAVTGNLFPLLDVDIHHGRGLEESDDVLSTDPAAVISFSWWQSVFGARPDVLGSTIYLNYRPFTVVGVAGPEFLGTTADARPDVWIPIAHFRDRYVGWDRSARDRDTPLARVYARFAGGDDRGRAEAVLGGVASGLDAAHPRERGPRRIRLVDATWIDPRTRLEEAATIRTIAVGAGGLLLLVCANIANMLLAISMGRRREMAARAALGASPLRLARAALVENGILALAAGAVAVLVAAPATRRLGSYFARPSVWGETVARVTPVDGTVVLFTLLLAVLAGVLASLLPALRASRTDLAGVLRSDDGGRSLPVRLLRGHRVPGADDLLVTTQVALSVVLLVVAGLVVRTFSAARAVNPGFEYETVISSHISTSSTDLAPDQRGRFFEEISQALEAEPWVRSVAVKDNALLAGQAQGEFRPNGAAEAVSAIVTRTLPGFFEDLEIPLVEGRDFQVQDSAAAPKVAIVTAAAARRFFGTGSAVGQTLWWDTSSDMGSLELEVVGVVGDLRIRDVLVPPEPTVFIAYLQHPFPTGSALHIRATGDPAGVVPQVQRWLREYEPHLAIVNVLPYSQVVAGSLYAQRMNAELFAVLAVLALLLAAFGIFSVLTLSVGRRTREIGVRMAIGAPRGSIGRLMLGRGMAPVLPGLGIGLVAAAAATRLATGLLYGVEATDPAAWLGGMGVLLLTAALAAWLPARRAAALDPLDALREG